jgi:hypothetical protein
MLILNIYAFFSLSQKASCSIAWRIARAIFFLIAATSEWKSPIIILLRYITSKITLLLQSYSLIFFVAILLPRKKKFEVYFSTGNKGVDGGDIPPDFALTIKGSWQISFPCLEFR